MKQATGYWCNKCEAIHLSPGNWPMSGTSMPKVEGKLYVNHKKYRRLPAN